MENLNISELKIEINKRNVREQIFYIHLGNRNYDSKLPTEIRKTSFTTVNILKSKQHSSISHRHL